MTFLNPLVLLGLVAAAIPLLIHLFQFQQPKTVDFSSIAFIQALEESTIRRMRIKRWLLLALRTLAIVCLVLAFARPTLTGQMAGALGGAANSSMGIVVDNSLSMTLRSSSGAYIDQAKRAAAEVVRQMQRGDEVFLGLTAGSERSVSRYTTRSSAEQALQEVAAAGGSEPLTQTIRRTARRLEEGRHPNRQIFVFSDFQNGRVADTVQQTLPEQVQLGLVPVQTGTPSNVAVTDVEIVSRILETGQAIQMEATLANYGSKPVEGYVASVFLEETRVAQSAATVEPGTRETVSFTVTPQSRGWLTGHVEIESDSFEPDNRRRFTLHIPERREVLIVRGENQSTEYLELAYSSDLAGGRGAFETTIIPERQLPARALDGTDMIVLAGVHDFSSGEVESLTRYVENGGGVFFFPARDAAAEDYNAWFSSLEAGSFSGFVGSLGSRQPTASTERADLEHPLFRTMFASTEGPRERQLEEVLVSFAMNYSPGGGNEQTLIYLSNGRPFLHEIRHGQGQVFLSAVAPTPEWSDLPLRGLFVPLLYRAGYYLSAGSSMRQASYTLGTGHELAVSPVRMNGGQFRFVGPGGEEFVPEQRTVLGQTRIRLDEFQEPGIYDLMLDDRLVRRLALNTQTVESDVRAMDPKAAAERLQQAFGQSVDVYESGAEGSRASLGETVRHQRFGVELWNVFLLIALACLAGEMFAAKQQPSRETVGSQ